ncbi:MAG: type II toxin-antitoxin system PemK/MazF family toxin [Actinobacteria bacterium]|nr:MAG: type II toxin-antitoxin system PemK/MazF family toxin [Actinomycetota bacterium]
MVVCTQKRQLPPDRNQRPQADGHHEEFDEQAPRRGEVWLADLDKVRPVIVLTRDPMGQLLHAVLVAPVTSTVRGIRRGRARSRGRPPCPLRRQPGQSPVCGSNATGPQSRAGTGCDDEYRHPD